MSAKTLLIDESEFIDFKLFGILSSFTDPIRFVYHVNKNFDTRFERCEDLDVLIDGLEFFFPVFEWEDRQTGVYYNIIKNLGYTENSHESFGTLSSLFEVEPVLIQPYKKFNFLLKISGEEADEMPLKESAVIQIIKELETNSVKTINRLVF